MNKFVISIVIVAIVAIALGTASYVFAQSPTPQVPVPGSSYGNGMMGSRGNRGGMMTQSSGFGAGMGMAVDGTQDEILHDELIAIYAEELGISVEELNARISNGETLVQIATAEGLTIEEIRTLMVDARAQAVELAVKNGTLTQEQADWMNQRGAAQSMSNGARGRGVRTTGQGQLNNLDCPLYQTNP